MNLVQQKGKRKYLTEAGIEYVIDSYRSGKSIQDIAKELNITWNSIKGILKRRNIYKVKYPNISYDTQQEIIKLYNDLSSKLISKKLNISKTAVLDILERHNVPRRINDGRLQRKYKVNHNYFCKIDDQDKAYILGFLFADGYNNEENGYIQIILHHKDVEILEFIKSKLCPDKPIYDIIKSNEKQYKSLCIYSKQISKDLSNLGCVQNKTFKITFPNIPEEYVSHFVRGYVDGDGYITYNMFEVVGTELFVLHLQKILMKECSLNKTKLKNRHKIRNNNIRSIVYGGRKQVSRIKSYLLKDANFYLKRKYKKL